MPDLLDNGLAVVELTSIAIVLIASVASLPILLLVARQGLSAP